MVGQNSRGNWVVRDQKGVCGGLFVSREAALRFVRAENGYRSQAIVMVSGNIELDTSGGPSGLPCRETSIDLQRRIACGLADETVARLAELPRRLASPAASLSPMMRRDHDRWSGRNSGYYMVMMG